MVKRSFDAVEEDETAQKLNQIDSERERIFTESKPDWRADFRQNYAE